MNRRSAVRAAFMAAGLSLCATGAHACKDKPDCPRSVPPPPVAQAPADAEAIWVARMVRACIKVGARIVC